MNDTHPEPAQLPIVPASIRTAALTELAVLTRSVEGLSVEDWKKPSAAEGWTVGDVVAHLDLAIGLYNRLLGFVTAGHGGGSVWKTLGKIGETVIPAASPALNAINNAIPRLIDKALSPEVVKGQFAAGTRTLQGRLERIEGKDYTRPIYYVGGPYPLSFFLALMVNELAIHRWDMESRFQPDAHLDLEARSVLPWFYFSGTPFMLRMPKGMTGSIQAVLHDPGAAMWWRIESGKVTQGTQTTENPDVTIRGGSGVFALTLAGRIKPDDALRGTSLTAEGNEPLATSFLNAWRII